MVRKLPLNSHSQRDRQEELVSPYMINVDLQSWEHSLHIIETTLGLFELENNLIIAEMNSCSP